MKRVLIPLAAILVAANVVCSAGTPSPGTVPPTQSAAKLSDTGHAGSAPTYAPAPTSIQFPTDTPIPTDTAYPTNTPRPTRTPTQVAKTPVSTRVLSPTPLDNTAVVQAETLNVRSGPGVAYEVVGQVRKGDILDVTGCNQTGDWLCVTNDSADGWVSLRYVSFGGDVGALPKVTAQAPQPTNTPSQVEQLATIFPDTAVPRDTPTVYVKPAATPYPTPVPAPQPAPRACCKICTTGKACGDTCISRSKTCHVGPGCACDG